MKIISRMKKSNRSGIMKKMCMAFLLILTMCVVTLNTAVPGAYAISELEANLGLNESSGSGTNNMLGNIINIIAMLARVVGILLGVYGLYKLIVALKDQDANGITQGIVLLAVGIILIMFKTIVTLVFGIQLD